MEDDFIVQAVDEITRTGWASLQSLESGSVDKLVTQKVQGLGNDGIGTSKTKREEVWEYRVNTPQASDPETPGNAMTGQ